MKILGNILWLVFGGLMIALEYFVAGIALCVTLIGIPFGIQAFKLGVLSLWPFGNKVVNMPQEPGCLSVVMNILWILIGGIWIALYHLLWGIVLCITIVGIPFGRQHFKLMALSFTPFGKSIV